MPKILTDFVAFVAKTLTVREVQLGFSLLGASSGKNFCHALNRR
jgi:hypothetical protein